INPDDVVREYGADSLRLFEMFMGPLEAVKPWSTAGVVGVRGFLDRAWRLMVDDRAEEIKLNESVQTVAPSEEALRVLHKTIKRGSSPRRATMSGLLVFWLARKSSKRSWCRESWSISW